NRVSSRRRARRRANHRPQPSAGGEGHASGDFSQLYFGVAGLAERGGDGGLGRGAGARVAGAAPQSGPGRLGGGPGGVTGGDHRRVSVVLVPAGAVVHALCRTAAGFAGAGGHLRQHGDHERRRCRHPAGRGPRCVPRRAGGDNGTLDPIEVPRRQSVAVDVLALGAGGQVPAAATVTIANVQAPRRVLLGSECELQATVRREGTVTRPVNLNVFANDTLVAVRPVTFVAGQWETSLRLTHRPARPGLTSYA